MAKSVKKTMSEIGFTLVDTGGGCTAYSKSDDTIGEVLVTTAASDSGAPESMNEKVLVGFYGLQHSEELVALVLPTLHDFVKAVRAGTKFM